MVGTTEGEDIAADLIRTVSRHSLAYMLCAASEMFRHYDFDPLDLMIIHAVLNANVLKIMKTPELDRQFGSIQAVEPDKIKQGVSRAALSRFFGLPIETVRRRADRLKKQGIFRETDQGLIVTEANQFKFGNNHELQRTNMLLVRKFLRDLTEAGVELPGGIWWTIGASESGPHQTVRHSSSGFHALFGRKATMDPLGSSSRIAASIAFANAAWSNGFDKRGRLDRSLLGISAYPGLRRMTVPGRSAATAPASCSPVIPGMANCPPLTTPNHPRHQDRFRLTGTAPMIGRGIRTSSDENQLRIMPAASLHRKVPASVHIARPPVIREGTVTRCCAGKGVVRYEWQDPGTLGRRCDVQHATSLVICFTRKRAQWR
jgi:hypothetical protein